jgi:hypothetical protein
MESFEPLSFINSLPENSIMKKIVALSLIAAASLSLAACKNKETTVENNTTVVDNTAGMMEDTNAAMADSNAVAPAMDNASNAM